MSLFIDLSAIQSVPVANLNRDDLGSPKTVKYGNATRIRVSSQAWKRVIRHGVEDDLGDRAARTRQVPHKVHQELENQGWPAELAAFAGAQVAASAGKKGLATEKEGHTSVLVFLPREGIKELASVCGQHRAALEEGVGKKKPGQVLPTDEIEEILKRRTTSISLLGRMLAELPGANVDGAAHVAHAFTTHASEPQRDYFTAVDDWLGSDATGSGHLDTAEFSAGVFYRYACVNVTDLITNLDEDHEAARTALASFAEQFLFSLPQAKRTSTAPHTVPELAYLAVRKQRPISLAGAFETPVPADAAGGFSTPSRKTLAAYAKDINRLTGRTNRAFDGHACITMEETLDGLGKACESFAELIDKAVTAALPHSGGQQ